MLPFILNSTFMQKVIENKHKVGMNLGEPLKRDIAHNHYTKFIRSKSDF